MKMMALARPSFLACFLAWEKSWRIRWAPTPAYISTNWLPEAARKTDWV